jgi:hypothetical protein
MKTLEAAAMRQSATVMIKAEKLPKEFAGMLKELPIRGSHLRITVEELEESDEQKLMALRAAIQKGCEDIAAGRVIDGKTAFNKLRDKHFPGRK